MVISEAEQFEYRTANVASDLCILRHAFWPRWPLDYGKRPSVVFCEFSTDMAREHE